MTPFAQKRWIFTFSHSSPTSDPTSEMIPFTVVAAAADFHRHSLLLEARCEMQEVRYERLLLFFGEVMIFTCSFIISL